MKLLTKQILWHNPYGVERLPLLSRLHRAAFTAAPRLRQQLFRYPLIKLFPLVYKAGLGGQGVLRLRTGAADKLLPFDARNLQFSSLYMPQHAHGYEPETAALLDALIEPDGVFFDIGSNWGYYALFIASRKDFRGQVHAFEPGSSVFKNLQELVAGAGLGGSISCHELALSDSAGDGFIAIPDGMHSGLAKLSNDGGEAPIKLARLDDLGLPPPTAIKMDVEDHEAQVLSGAASTLKKNTPHLIFESWLHEDRPAATEEPFRVLRELGYDFFSPVWLKSGADGAYPVQNPDLTDGAPASLALVPFEPEQRFLLREQMNVLACHKDRIEALTRLF